MLLGSWTGTKKKLEEKTQELVQKEQELDQTKQELNLGTALGGVRINICHIITRDTMICWVISSDLAGHHLEEQLS